MALERRVLRVLLPTCLGMGILVLLIALPAAVRLQGAETLPHLSPSVVINEVAWSGTAVSFLDEWIELWNSTGSTLSLDGWVLASLDGGLHISLTGTISPHGFYLLERIDDDTVSDIPADQIFTGSLGNWGEQLVLRNPAGGMVDSANLDDGHWPAGSSLPDFYSMERIDPFAVDSDQNWISNTGIIRNGLDAAQDPLNGTPKAWNSGGVVADLVVRKWGPYQALPGAQISYALTATNWGGLTATGVVLTDLLPSAAAYLGDSSPFSLTQPTSQTLVWELGDLAPRGAAAGFYLTVQLSQHVTGMVTNQVQVATTALERDLDSNRSSWDLLVADPIYQVDLVAAKEGPSQVAAGGSLTYAIALHNQGTLTAAHVLITDRLPAAVTYLGQDWGGTPSPTFTQPAAGLLSWELAPMPPGSAVSWTVTGAVSAAASGPMSNVITATSEGPECDPADNSAGVGTQVIYTPVVRLMALHYHALGGGDEAVQLVNFGLAPTDIGLWRLTDNHSEVRFSPGIVLQPGGSIWVADEALAFREQFGFPPDYELGDTDTAVPKLEGTWPGFANEGDEVVLLDGNGLVQDALVYLGGDINQPGWAGPSVEPYRPGRIPDPGHILYRKLDQASGRPVPDTDTAADWAQDRDDPINGRKVRYPGWDLETYFQTAAFTQTAVVTVAVGPDTLYEVMAEVITEATQSLMIHSYTFENTPLAHAAAARAAAGVSVTLLLDGSPVGGLSDQERWVCQQIEAAGGACFFSLGNTDQDIYQRYQHQHAKYLVIDGELALIGSGNLGMDSMPPDDKTNGTAGQRSVYLLTDAPGVVSHLETLFALDLDPIHHHDITTTAVIGPPPGGYQPLTGCDWTTYTARFSTPLTVQGQFSFELIQSPENSLRDGDALLGLLARAGPGDTVLVQQLEEPTYWGETGASPAEDPNLRLEAYIAAARRGASVRILLDNYYDREPDSPRDNWATCAYLLQLATSEGLSLRCQLGDPTALGLHNKMILVQIEGHGYIHLGSINGSEISSKANRELAIQLRSDPIYDYLAAMFEVDWPHIIYLPLVQNRTLTRADYPLISEVLYNPGDEDLDQEWLELYNPLPYAVSLAGWMVGDAVLPEDFEGMYLFPAGATIGAHQALVVATSGERFFLEYGAFPDYEILSLTPGAPDMVRHPTWGLGDFMMANPGDELLLLDPTGAAVDVVLWGESTFPDVLPHPGVALGGHSLERYPAWLDTDDCSHDMRDWPFPVPGGVSGGDSWAVGSLCPSPREGMPCPVPLPSLEPPAVSDRAVTTSAEMAGWFCLVARH